MNRTAIISRPLGLAVAVIMTTAVTGSADTVMTFDLSAALLNYTAANTHLNVSEAGGSALTLTKENSVTSALIDSGGVFGGGNFNFLLSLDLNDLAGANNWSASGTVGWTDLATGNNAVEASFTSSALTLSSTGSDQFLEIRGVLSTSGSNTSILVNRGNPWTFDGNFSVDGAREDGVDGDFFMSNPDSYTGGTLVTLKFGIAPGETLDSLFGADRTLSNGNVKGSIVPIPGAALLGALGLGLVGCKRSRR